MNYHISDEGARLESEVDYLKQAVAALRSAGFNQVDHEKLNDIGQAINRVGCVLCNIGAVTPTLDADDTKIIEKAVNSMRILSQHLPVNYSKMIKPVIEYYANGLTTRQAELLETRECVEA